MRIAYSAVLITKDRPTYAIDAIAGLLRQQRLPARVIVVDASETPLELPPVISEQAAERSVELLLMRSVANTGAQRNLGVEHVETPTTLFIDDDVVLTDEYMEGLLGRWEVLGIDALGGAIGARDLPIPRVSRVVRGALGFAIDNRSGAPRMRRSGKMIHVPDPGREVYAEAVCVGATLYRTDLLRRFPFEERFPGYVLGEDFDVSYRIGRVSPILVCPSVFWEHPQAQAGRDPLGLWYARSRHDAFFRWRRIGRSPLALGAFGWSVATETAVATFESVRHRDRGPLFAYLRGFRDWIGDERAGVGSAPPPARTARRGTSDSAGEPARP
jgi:GT2 family glycosyltransferase